MSISFCSKAFFNFTSKWLFYGFFLRQKSILFVSISFIFEGTGLEIKTIGAFILDFILFYLLSMNLMSLVIIMKLRSYPLIFYEAKFIHSRME